MKIISEDQLDIEDYIRYLERLSSDELFFVALALENERKNRNVK